MTAGEPHPVPAHHAGTGGFMRGIWYSLRYVSPSIQWRLNPARFRVVVCSPVWAGKLAGPMRTYLQQAGKFPRLCGAAVSGAGGRQSRFFREMEQLGGQGDIPTLSLMHRQIDNGTYEHPLEIFVEMLQTSLIEAA
ncbi:flavodoxin family protein [Methylobacterium sp. P31]